MVPAPPTSPRLDDVAHTIQVALTPVFLLSGIGTLINVFAARLARVGDQIDKAIGAVAQAADAAKRSAALKLASLRRRLLALDLAVILGTLGGASTCAAVLTLFYGSLREDAVASALYGFFAVAILCTIAALCAFLYEMLIASHVLRVRVARSAEKAGL